MEVKSLNGNWLNGAESRNDGFEQEATGRTEENTGPKRVFPGGSAHVIIHLGTRDPELRAIILVKNRWRLLPPHGRTFTPQAVSVGENL
jgi:hypothetical protein